MAHMCGTRVQCSVLCDRDLCRAQRASKRSATIYQRLSAFWEEAISRSIQRSAYFVALQELLDLPVGSLGQQVQSSTEYMQLIDPTDITEKQLLQWFETIDLNKDGELDAGELQRALAMGNLHFSLAVVAHMIRIQNHGRADSLSCPEFCKLHGFLTDMQQSFQYFGQAHAGQLQQPEALEALQHAGFQLDEMAFSTLFKAFNPDCTNWLSIAEYIALTLFLQSASATFEAFDEQKKGVVTLNFNQWIYTTANVV